jgi:hypothetical protein
VPDSIYSIKIPNNLISDFKNKRIKNMKDLLKEAIADAKAVRETALANAKLALEEAFTPRLQSMLSAKLAEEMSDDEEMAEGEEEGYADNMAEFDVTEGEDEAPAEEAPAEEEAPEEEEEDDDLDLEEIIRELELSEEEGEEGHEEMTEEEDEEMNEEDEDIDINEIIRALREEEEDEMMEGEDEEMTEEEESGEELEEAYNVIRFLKGKINEVNLLNAKLLYSNKLFRNFTLNEGQKMKVIENFDRAHNLREVKLVYSTLAEGFKMPSTKKVVKESFASKPVASTRPAKRVLSEGADLAARFQKLAGLKK